MILSDIKLLNAAAKRLRCPSSGLHSDRLRANMRRSNNVRGTPSSGPYLVFEDMIAYVDLDSVFAFSAEGTDNLRKNLSIEVSF